LLLFQCKFTHIIHSTRSLTLSSIPNIPGFYLLYRAYSHYKAWSGSQHLELLVNKQLLKSQPSELLNEIYSAHSKLIQAPIELQEKESSDQSPLLPDEEVMFLNKESGSRIADAFDVNELGVEIERAVEQVEKKIQTEKDAKKQQP
jgi:hypothetical protein